MSKRFRRLRLLIRLTLPHPRLGMKHYRARTTGRSLPASKSVAYKRPVDPADTSPLRRLNTLSGSETLRKATNWSESAEGTGPELLTSLKSTFEIMVRRAEMAQAPQKIRSSM